MFGVDRFSRKYFNKFSTNPVKIVPYNPITKTIANKYIGEIKNIIKDDSVEVTHRGSTAFGITGKRDIEIGIYLNDKNWIETLNKLANFYGVPENSEIDYARFNKQEGEYEVEIVLMKGSQAEIDKKISNFLKGNSLLLKKYEKLKRKYSYSKREYQIQKFLFFRKILKKLL